MSQAQQSESDSESVQTSNQNNYARQPAIRATMEEINQAKDGFKTSNAERAPWFQLLPTGVGANRVLVAGALTEVTDVGKDTTYLRAKIIGESGTVYAYAGKYAPDEVMAFLKNAEPPMFVAMCAKMDLYPEEDPIEERNVSLNPEWITQIDGDRRDEIILENALATIERADGDNVPQLVERAEEQYKYDDNYENTDFRAGAVRVIESIDEKFGDEDEEEEEQDAEVVSEASQ